MKISILQWNIWGYEDIRNTAVFLKQQAADIVCLQELTIGSPNQTIKDTPKYITEQLKYHSHYTAFPIIDSGKEYQLANGIFSKFPLAKRRSVWVNQQEATGGYDDQYRAYVEAAIAVDGHNLTIGTTHLSYTHGFVNRERKRKEVQKLETEISSTRGNYIFTGDLNSRPHSYAIKMLRRHLHHAGPSFEYNTWTTKPFSYGGFVETELRWRLDYVFASKNIKVIDSQIITTKFSDHLPILTTIELGV